MWLQREKFTDLTLTDYTQKLIGYYVDQPVKISSIGEGGSDHQSWAQEGYKTVFPHEYIDLNDKTCGNRTIHSAEDTMDKLSLAQMTDYLKLAAAFTVELGEPVTNLSHRN